MKKFLNSGRIVGIALIIFFIVNGCQKDGVSILESTTDAEQTNHDSQQAVATMQDVAGVTASAFTRQGITSGRVADEDNGGSIACGLTVTSNIKLDRTHADSIIYSGTITIDYGTGLNCPDSVVRRKGIVIDSFVLVLKFKDSEWYSLSEKIRFERYSRDSTQLNGSISIASSSTTPTVITMNETKVKYADSTSSTWSGSLVFTIQNPGHHWGGTMDITGSWSGTTRNGTSFSASISKAIEYKSDCLGYLRIPVSGTLDITAGGVSSIIDYGNGTCDKIYTVNIAGVVTTYKFRRSEC